jgi:uncharacterized membrane protein YgdD (TMEM256/DUF423 family)
MSDHGRFCIRAAGCNGLLAVAFGAFGAHGLKHLAATLPADQGARMVELVDTGARYQLLHAAALLGLAGLAARPGFLVLPWAARCLFFGSFVFSASLYALALGGPQWLGLATPIGGAGMLAGWGLLLTAVGTP